MKFLTKIALMALILSLALTGLAVQAEEEQATLAYFLLDGNEWSQIYAAAGKAKCEELGIAYLEYNCDGDVMTQIDQVQACISLGVDGIAIQCASNEALAPVLKQAAEAGIAVISCFDIEEELGINDLIYFTVYGQYQAGEIVGQELLKYVDSGEYAVIGGTPGASNSIQRKQGIIDAIGDKMTCVANIDANWDAAEAQAAAEDILTSHPNITAILPIDDGMAVGVYEAIAAAGLAGEVYLGSINGSEVGIQMVRDGEMICTVTVPTKWFAESQAQLLRDLLDGKDVERYQIYQPEAITQENCNDNFDL